MGIIKSKEEKEIAKNLKLLKRFGFELKEAEELVKRIKDLNFDLSKFKDKEEVEKGVTDATIKALEVIANKRREDVLVHLKNLGYGCEGAMQVYKNFGVLGKDLLEFENRESIESFFKAATGDAPDVTEMQASTYGSPEGVGFQGIKGYGESIEEDENLKILEPIAEALVSKDPATIIQAGRDLMTYGKSKL